MAFSALVEDVSALLIKARNRNGQAHLVLSGGQTPAHYLPQLAGCLEDWRGISVSLSDERWVPVDHADSNEAMIRKHFLVLAQGALFTGMMGRGDDPVSDARRATQTFEQLHWPADVTILGAAPDGHVASLFSGSGIGHDTARVIATKSPNGDARLSMSAEALLQTHQIIIVTSGPAKHAALKVAMEEGAVNECPVRLVMAQDKVPVKIIEFK